MNLLVTLLLFGAAAVFAPRLALTTAATSAVVAITVAIALAILADGQRSARAVAAGALGALGFVALAPYGTDLAAGALFAAIYTPRALRGRTSAIRGIHVAVAALAGVAAFSVAQHFAASSGAGVVAATALVAGILGATPLLVPVRDPIAATLAGLADTLEGSSRAILVRGATVRDRVVEHTEALSPRAVARLERAWHGLVATARARTMARGRATSVLDDRLAAHLETLERVYAAADERLACTVGLGDKSLEAARLEAESLDAETAALQELTTVATTDDTKVSTPEPSQSPS